MKRFRFRLRTMFIAIAAFALLLAAFRYGLTVLVDVDVWREDPRLGDGPPAVGAGFANTNFFQFEVAWREWEIVSFARWGHWNRTDFVLFNRVFGPPSAFDPPGRKSWTHDAKPEAGL